MKDVAQMAVEPQEVEHMGKHISITHKGKTYTLEFTRKSIETMERRGFVITDVAEKPMSTLPALFEGAFLANHTGGIKRKEIQEIYDCIDNKRELVNKLAEMYNDPMEKLFDGDDIEKGKNISWDADF